MKSFIRILGLNPLCSTGSTAIQRRAPDPEIASPVHPAQHADCAVSKAHGVRHEEPQSVGRREWRMERVDVGVH